MAIDVSKKYLYTFRLGTPAGTELKATSIDASYYDIVDHQHISISSAGTTTLDIPECDILAIVGDGAFSITLNGVGEVAKCNEFFMVYRPGTSSLDIRAIGQDVTTVEVMCISIAEA